MLAIDGSVIELPNTAALRAANGATENQSPRGALARARSSALYDVLNGLVIHTVLDRYDAAERDLAKQHLRALVEGDLGSRPNLVLFDRGYPSTDLILFLHFLGIRYLMRVASSFWPEIGETTEPDTVVTIRITRERARQLARQGTSVPVGTEITVRVLKIKLPTGETKTLITDLTPKRVAL